MPERICVKTQQIRSLRDKCLYLVAGSAGHLPSLRHLLPAAAESFVELHHAQQLIQTDLRQRQFRLE